MKKLTVLIAIVLVSGTLSAQQRGGRNNTQFYRNSNLNVSDNNSNPEISNLYYNVDNNVGNYNNEYVQTSNVNFNTNIIQVQQQQINVTPPAQNVVVNRNVNVVNNDVVLNTRGNRGEVEVQRNVPDSRGNVYEMQSNDIPEVVEQQINIEPVQQVMVIDNVDNQLAINANPNINIPSPAINVDRSFELNLGNESNEVINKDTEKVKETKVKEEKKISVSISIPDIDLVSERSISSKKSTSLRTKKVRVKRNFGYQQHVSVIQKFKAKTAGLKKLVAKKTKKIKCSVVCYKF